MISEDLTTVATFEDAPSANIAKISLEAEGIPAFVMGAEATTALWHVGTALGGVKLQVARRDAENAAKVLELIHSSSQPSIDEWTCHDCGESVDEGFDTCWSCGASFDPERSPAKVEPQGSLDTAADEATFDADEDATRAWRSAVLGIVIVPFLFYALYLVVRTSNEELSPRATRHFYGALAILIVMLPAWWLMLRYMIGLG